MGIYNSIYTCVAKAKINYSIKNLLIPIDWSVFHCQIDCQILFDNSHLKFKDAETKQILTNHVSREAKN
jgi:hypothetical protein